MKKICFYLSVICIAALFFACDNVSENPTISAVEKSTFGGYVQKGPFANGAEVTIAELDDVLDQTGRAYSTNIISNSGEYEKKNITLVSHYALLKANGYYFNEVKSAVSESQITLSALVDMSEVNSANINVLTHLERARVEYLIKSEHLSFSAAKQQAQKEVLSVFGFELPADAASEALNLTDNATLLAVSCILQGYLSAGEMSELMANIISDIQSDGKLDDSALGSQLVNNASSLVLPFIRAGLENKYKELGKEVSIPDFESLVTEFLKNAPYEQTVKITYPAEGIHGLNVLSDEFPETIQASSIKYSLAADIPKGFNLKIVLSDRSDEGGGEFSWSYGIAPAPINWVVGLMDQSTKSQVFTVAESGKSADVLIVLYAKKIEVAYFENNAIVPTKTKIIQVLTPSDKQ